jgi:cellulose synthase (UDP-forming)
MTATGLWQNIGAGENILTKFLRLVFLLAAGVVFYFLAVLPLSWPQQAVLGLLTLLMATATAPTGIFPTDGLRPFTVP